MTLSSHQADISGCGLPRAPWIIKTPTGQRVNVTLVDFGWSEDNVNTGVINSNCKVYGFIVERSLGMNTTFCGGGGRETHVYLSASSEVEIAILPHDKRDTSSDFLLLVKGKVL